MTGVFNNKEDKLTIKMDAKEAEWLRRVVENSSGFELGSNKRIVEEAILMKRKLTFTLKSWLDKRDRDSFA